MSRAANDAVRAVNRLLAAGDDVFEQATDLKRTFFVGAKPGTFGRLQAIATELGISFGAAKLSMTGAKLRAPRIGLWDQYGGSMESGWTRWILEQFEFPFARVFAPELDAGDLHREVRRADLRGRRNPRDGFDGGGRGGRGARRRSEIRRTFPRNTGRRSAESPQTARCRSSRRSSRAAAR